MERITPEKEILNMDEAADLFNVSVKTFIKLLKEEKVPARKIGREWRFSRKALIGWLSSGDSQTYSGSESDTKDFFNSVASEWEVMSRGYYDESVKNKLISLKLLKSDMTVIDLGAGNGYLSRAVAGYVRKVLAVDISAEMLSQLRKKALEEGLTNIETREGDGCDMSVADGSVDLVCANMYLHHIEDIESAIKEMFRVLKAGGNIFLADLAEHSNTELKEQMHDIWQGFKPTELRKVFERSGFKNVKVQMVEADGRKSSGVQPEMFVLTAVKA